MKRILLTGTGMTSAVTAALLRQELSTAELVIWDKARVTGGRMSTYQNSKDEKLTVDLGSQYISATPDYASVHSTYYNELVTAGILTPLLCRVGGMKDTIPGMQHYVAPRGSSSIVQHYLHKSAAEIKFGQHVSEINSCGKCWEVNTVNGYKDSFDVVVLTMPVPQILGLLGSVKDIIEKNRDLHRQLQLVKYSSRYALGLFFPEGSDIVLSGKNSAEYITGDSVVRFVAIDNLKRGLDHVASSVVVHTSVPFGIANIDKTPEEVKSIIVARVKEMFPHWPQPTIIKCHKWHYSQVTSAYPGLPGAVKIDEGLFAGGDGFTHSNMDGCIESAKAVAETVLSSLR